MLHDIDIPRILQIDLLALLMGQRTFESSYWLESALKSFQTPREFLAVGNSCTSHAPLRPVSLRSHGIHAAHRGALARVLRTFRNVQVGGQLRLGHFST